MRTAAVLVAALVLTGAALAAGSPTAGKTVFKSKCGTCHSLKAAGTVSKGPNQGPALTNKSLSRTKIMKELQGGNTGLMPIFVGVLTTKQINDVVAFVIAASKPGAK